MSRTQNPAVVAALTGLFGECVVPVHRDPDEEERLVGLAMAEHLGMQDKVGIFVFAPHPVMGEQQQQQRQLVGRVVCVSPTPRGWMEVIMRLAVNDGAV